MKKYVGGHDPPPTLNSYGGAAHATTPPHSNMGNMMTSLVI